MTLIIAAIVIRIIIKIELPLIKSYSKINFSVFVAQSAIHVTIFAKTGYGKVLSSAWRPGNQNDGQGDRNLCVKRSIEGEKMCYFGPFGIRNTQDRSRVAFARSYAII